MSNVVKYLHSDMPGAPVLSGTVGALIGVLDACLKDGFGLQSVGTLTVAGGVATATVSGAPSAEVGSVVLVVGATPSGLNGEKRVTAVTGNSVSYDATGISDQTATGAISVKAAPLGWSKLFSGTNLAMYQSANVASLGFGLRVDDTNATDARMVGCEGIYDINNAAYNFPTSTQQSGGLYWSKSNINNSTSRKWLVIGDDLSFYYWCAPHSTNITQGTLHYFGDLLPQVAADRYACGLTGHATSQVSASATITTCMGAGGYTTSSTGLYLPRSHGQMPGAAIGWKCGEMMLGTASIIYSGASQTPNLAFPHPGDNLLALTRVLGGNSGALRGRFPGLHHVPQYLVSAYQHRDVVLGTDDFAGKRLLGTRQLAPNASSNDNNMAFFDVTGPWR